MDNDVASPEIPPEPVKCFAGEVPTDEELARLFAYFWYVVYRTAQERTLKATRTAGKPDENLRNAEGYKSLIARICSREPTDRLMFAQRYWFYLGSKTVTAGEEYFQATMLALQDMSRREGHNSARGLRSYRPRKPRTRRRDV